jgi:signal transduction histidine kinase
MRGDSPVLREVGVDAAARRSRRVVIAISLWLLVVPAALLTVRMALPADDLVTVPPGQTFTGGGVALAPAGSVAGVEPDDVLIGVNGLPVRDVLAGHRARSTTAGQVLTYQVRHHGTVRDVTVRLRAHPNPLGLFRSQQPDVVVVSLAMLVLAGWLLRRRPDERAAHAFLLFAAGWASSAVSGLAWPQVVDFWARPWYVVWADVGLGGYLVSGIATLLFALAFPVARGGLTRRTWVAAAVLPLAFCAGFAGWVAAHGTRTGDFTAVNIVAEICWQGCTLAALAVIAVRWFRLRRDLEARRRIQIVLLGLAATLVIVLAGKWAHVPAGSFGFGLVLLLFPAAVAVALTRRNLYELDVALNRGLVAFGSTAVLLSLYLTVAVATAQVTRGDGPLVALPAAGAVAVAFAPVRARIQALVSRRLFGSAGDPQLVLHRLGVRLEASADPEALVAAVVDTAAETLRLPYVALQLMTDDDSWVVAHERGRPGVTSETFDITVGDRLVGRLVAAPRRDARALSPLDRRTLTDLARHSAVAARVVALLTDLRVAQQRLLVAREEERHRIHRDLHDGIGPALVGLTLQLEVAADLAGDGELSTLTRRLHAEAARTTDDVRRMVRDLRPGELEELGLPAAVAAAAARLSSPHAPQFDLDTPVSLPELSAHVEDAAYKICLEAMTNVIKHSHATRCTIRLSHTPTTLDVEISDDGRGITPNATTGTGLHSMRDRATAVGGQLTLSSGNPSGTTVRACLPHQPSAGCP